MTVRRGSVLAGVIVLFLFSVGVATASGPLVIPIPGFAGSALQVGGVARTNDGGAIVAGSQRDPGATGWQPAVMRLHVDGSIDLGYGTEGITRPRLGAGISATALAIDPQSGDAWVGTARRNGTSAIVALNGDGDRATRFAHAGIRWRSASSAPVALAWRTRRLLIAAGGPPCAGCRISVVDPSTGTTIVGGQLAPDQLGGPRCADGAVTSAVLTDPQTAQLAFHGGQHCGDRIVTISLARGDKHPTLHQSRSVPLAGGTPGEDLIAASGSDLCVASASSASSAFGPLIARRHVVASSRAPGGRLIALVALGSGACAANRGGAGVDPATPSHTRHRASTPPRAWDVPLPRAPGGARGAPPGSSIRRGGCGDHRPPGSEDRRERRGGRRGLALSLIARGRGSAEAP
jgi:hypothetical protein